MERSEARGELAASAALGCLYLALTPGHFQSIDGMLMFQQAKSIVFDGSLFFREPFVWGVPYETSLYGIGLSLAYVPSLWLFSGAETLVLETGSRLHDVRRVYLDGLYTLAGAPVNVVVTAITAHRVAALTRLLGGDRRTSLLALAFFGLGSPALVYAGTDFSQPLTALCVVIAVERALHFRLKGRAKSLASCAAAVAYCVLTRPLDAALLLPFVLLVCGTDAERARRAGGVLASAFGVACGLSLWINWARFGTFLHNEYVELGARFVDPTVGVVGLLVSPARGLLWAFPAILLSPLGARALLQRPEGRAVAFAMLGFPIALLGTAGSWHSWWGGACWGPRLVLPAIPLLAALAAVGLARVPMRWRGAVAVFLLLAGLAFAAPGVVTDFFSGYAGLVSTSEGSFRLEGYPPIGGWQFLERVFATSPLDMSAVDVFWFRIARRTRFLSLVPFVALLGLAGWLCVRVRRSLEPDFQETAR